MAHRVDFAHGFLGRVQDLSVYLEHCLFQRVVVAADLVGWCAGSRLASCLQCFS